MVFPTAGLLGAGFLGAAFVFGVAFEIDLLGEAFQRFCEAGRGEGAIMFPRGGIDGDVHARLGEDHITDGLADMSAGVR